MKTASFNRQIGCIYLIVGTEVGGGILALPLLMVHIGIVYGSIVLFAAWIFTLYTALLCCEANCSINGDNSFGTMADKILGKFWKIAVSIIFWITLSSLCMAYISAAGSIFNHIMLLPEWTVSLFFTIIFGFFVIMGTGAVDYANRSLLSVKLIFFIIGIVVLLLIMKSSYLSLSGPLISITPFLPIIVCSFFFHSIIPAARTYLNYDAKALKRCIIIGSFIPLILYILWVLAIIGNIPAAGTNGFSLIISEGKNANVGELLNLLSFNTKNNFVMSTINFVASISVTTSFLGVSLSLFHFTRDLFAHKKNSFNKKYLIPIILTFLIPLLIVISYPNIFITALDYAGAGATILFAVLPIFMVFKLKKKNYKFLTKKISNSIFLYTALAISIAIIFIEFYCT